MPTQRYKLTIAYRGSGYHGWQAQRHTSTYTAPAPDEGQGIPTIQETLARALAGIVRHPVDVVGSSRTDAGVHAKGQLAHFDTDQLQIPPEGLRRALNSALPADITVRALEPVPPAYDAIASTASKRYQYAIWNRADRPTFYPDLAWHRWQKLDVPAMREAAGRLVGTHDFASFARPGHGRENTVRTILACDVSTRGPLLVVGVEGTGFLWNMVRIIVGTLVEVGLGRTGADEIGRILLARERNAAGPTAPPHGLYLQWIKIKATRLDVLAMPPPPPRAGQGMGVDPAPPSIVIRAHHGQFTRQAVDVAKELPEGFTPSALKALAKDARFQRGFVAFVHQSFAGFLLFQVHEGVGQITWMGVRQDLHRQGVGRRLFERFASEMRSAGVNEVRGHAPVESVHQPSQAPALAFLGAMGFAEHARVAPSDNTDGPATLVLRMTL